MGTLYEERLRQHIGAESPRMEAVDAVGPQMIRHWVEVMHDRNPAFTDPEWAAASRFGSLVAPGAMMQVWSMAPLWPERDLPPLGGAGFSPVFLRNATAYGPSPRQRFDVVLSDHGLGLAPGVAFGPEGEGWLRWCFASRDPARLDAGLQRLAAALTPP